MDKQLETIDRQSKQRGFFDRPEFVDFWLNVGGRFWGGLMIGLGFGLFLGATLIKDELLPTDSGLWYLAWLVLFLIGFAITHRSVRRSAATTGVRSET
jgi:hypothetical protein